MTLDSITSVVPARTSLKIKKKQFKEIPQKCLDEWGSFPKHLSEASVSVCPGGSSRQVSAVREASSLSLTRPFFPSVLSHESHGHNRVSLMAAAPAGLKFSLCYVLLLMLPY